MVSQIDFTAIYYRTDTFTMTIYFAVFTVLMVMFHVYYGSTRRTKKVGEKVYGLSHIPQLYLWGPLGLFSLVVELLPISRTIEKGLRLGSKFPGFTMGRFLHKTVVFVYHPPLVQQVLRSTNLGHHPRPAPIFDLMRPFIGNGLLGSTGEVWQSQRKIMNKTQSLQSIKACLPMLNKHSIKFVENLELLFKDGKSHEINNAISVFFLQITCQMITGAPVEDPAELNRYHHNFQTWKTTVSYRFAYVWLWLNPLWKLCSMSRSHDKAVTELTNFARQKIEEHKRRWEGKSRKLKEENNFRCLLDELRDAGVNEQQILDEVNTTMFGGHDTGATVIHFFCFCLSLHPKIQEECRQEVDQLFGNGSNLLEDRTVTYEAVQSNLKQVERCILETLRLFPPGFLTARQLEEPLTLEYDNKLYLLPAGVAVGVATIGTHRNSAYFPDPNSFNPDRFLPEEVAKRHAYSFYPFSGGLRSCPGQKMAMVQMKLVAAYLLRNFIMTTNDTMEGVPLLPFITLTPARDYVFQFKKRTLKR